jgi:hypothetical protein
MSTLRKDMGSIANDLKSFPPKGTGPALLLLLAALGWVIWRVL